jgi:hypothetical protein
MAMTSSCSLTLFLLPILFILRFSFIFKCVCLFTLFCLSSSTYIIFWISFNLTPTVYLCCILIWFSFHYLLTLTVSLSFFFTHSRIPRGLNSLLTYPSQLIGASFRREMLRKISMPKSQCWYCFVTRSNKSDLIDQLHRPAQQCCFLRWMFWQAGPTLFSTITFYSTILKNLWQFSNK